MQPLSGIEQFITTDAWESSTSDRTGRVQGLRRELGFAYHCLLSVTTGRFREDRRLPAQHQKPFTKLERSGWVLREAYPRYYLCWQHSALILESPIRIAILPNVACGLTSAERSAILLFELFRRVARINLIESEMSGALADCPKAIAFLTRMVARRVLGDTAAGDSCALLLRTAELKIVEAAVGWRVQDTAGAETFLPPHLTRL